MYDPNDPDYDPKQDFSAFRRHHIIEGAEGPCYLSVQDVCEWLIRDEESKSGLLERLAQLNKVKLEAIALFNLWIKLGWIVEVDVPFAGLYHTFADLKV